MPVALTREQFCSLDCDPWVRQFLATRRTQTGRGVFRFIQQTQEFAAVPELVPQSICQFRDPPYSSALLPKSFVAAPLDATHNYCYSRLWHYDKAEAIRLVAGGLDHAIPVYSLFVSSEQLDQELQRLPQIQVTVENEVRNPIQRAVILTLTKDLVAFILDSTSRSVQ